MHSTVTVTQKQLVDLLLSLALVRPVFVWGQPGIGKSALVQEFAASIGLPCVSLLGSQLAPEDIIGVGEGSLVALAIAVITVNLCWIALVILLLYQMLKQIKQQKENPPPQQLEEFFECVALQSLSASARNSLIASFAIHFAA